TVPPLKRRSKFSANCSALSRTRLADRQRVQYILEPGQGVAAAMTACKIAQLGSRAVIEVSGDDAFHFLQNLVTNDVERARNGEAVHAALLTPQGKILFDFFIVAREGGGFWLDCRREIAADLAKRLTFYKLRARVEVANRMETCIVFAVWGGAPKTDRALANFPDPRL